MSGISKIRLLLRSVYLKGQMDAHKKTADVVFWEDDIIAQIIDHLKAEMPKKMNYPDAYNTTLQMRTTAKRDIFIDGFNQAIDAMTFILEKEKE